MKPKISYNGKKELVHEALGISDERFNEINYRASVIIHEFFKPTREGVTPNSDLILQQFIALAEDQQELVFLSYMAGVHIAQLFDDTDEDFELDEAETEE